MGKEDVALLREELLSQLEKAREARTVLVKQLAEREARARAAGKEAELEASKLGQLEVLARPGAAAGSRSALSKQLSLGKKAVGGSSKALAQDSASNGGSSGVVAGITRALSFGKKAKGKKPAPPADGAAPGAAALPPAVPTTTPPKEGVVSGMIRRLSFGRKKK